MCVCVCERERVWVCKSVCLFFLFFLQYCKIFTKNILYYFEKYLKLSVDKCMICSVILVKTVHLMK